MTDTLKAARILLENQSGTIQERETAIHQLSQNPTDEDIRRFVAALEDNDFGVRWAAAVALAEAGDRALPPLLRALIDRPNSVWLRQGAHHIFHYSNGPTVRQHAAEFMAATKGPAAELSTEQVAARLKRIMKMT